MATKPIGFAFIFDNILFELILKVKFKLVNG